MASEAMVETERVMSVIEKVKTPEEVELEAKQRELEKLDDEYATLELERATLEGEIGAFLNRRAMRLGILFAQLYGIRAAIREIEAGNAPDDAEAQQEAERAREKARDVAEDVGREDEPLEFTPSADLKSAYLEGVKLMHPDRGRDDADRELRHRLMVELNRAYEVADAALLAETIENYRRRVTPGDTDDIGTRLVRAIREIASTRKRIADLAREISELRESEDSRDKREVVEAEQRGEDPLGRIAERIRAQITAEQSRLDALRGAGDAAREGSPIDADCRE